MTILTFPLCCLIVAIWTISGAQGAGASPTCVKPSVVNLQTSSVSDSKSHHSKINEDWLLKKILSPSRLKNLQLNTDIRELAGPCSDINKELKFPKKIYSPAQQAT